MSKKIHELAKELNVTSKRLMEKLEEVGIHPKSHMSTLEEEELAKLYKHIGVVKKSDRDNAQAQPNSEGRHESVDAEKKRNAPRIIRKTEVVVRDTEDFSKPQTDPRKQQSQQPDRKAFVRTSNSNDGLMAGYVRGINPPSEPAIRKRPKPPEDEIQAIAVEKTAVPEERSEPIRSVERPAKPVDDILGVKKITREQRDERVHAENARELRHESEHASARDQHRVPEQTAAISEKPAAAADAVVEYTAEPMTKPVMDASVKDAAAAPETHAQARPEHPRDKAEQTAGQAERENIQMEHFTAQAGLNQIETVNATSQIGRTQVQSEQAVDRAEQTETQTEQIIVQTAHAADQADNATIAAERAAVQTERAAAQPERPPTTTTHSSPTATAAHAGGPGTASRSRIDHDHRSESRPVRPDGPQIVRDGQGSNPPRREGQGGAVIRPVGDRLYPPRDNQGGTGSRPPYPPREGGNFPPRDGQGVPGSRPYGDRPYPPREGGNFPPRDGQGSPGTRPYGDRPYPPRDGQSGPAGARPFGDRPYPPREGGSYPPRDGQSGPGARPFGDRPPYGGQSGPRPFGDRPSYGGGGQGGPGSRPYGDRPAYGGGGGGGRPGEGFDKDRVPYGAGGSRPGMRPGGPGAKSDKPAIVDEKAPQRGERRSMTAVDRQREAKKDTKKDSSRPVAPTTGAAGKFKPNTDIVGQKGSINDMYSDEFVINAFYNDSQEAMNAKRAEKRIRRGRTERVKHIPPKAVLTEVTIGETISVKALAEALKKTAADVIKRLFIMGSAATANQELDFDTASIIANEYGIAATKEVVVSDEEILFNDSDDKAESMATRAPVVVVMGHVDHGKTSLLDAIRSENIAESEAGGITQHIGAYTVDLHGRIITFLDTPGHEAFTAMRARGAQVTDIAIIVVAADDGVMPQTIEAIHHAKAAGVAIIIAINKIDKPNANQERVKQELTQHGIVIEEWGGDVIAVPVSAKLRQNIDQLLEMVVLTADVLELKADPDRQAKGTVVEARLDKNKGPIATLLVQRGTLRVGDAILSGSTFGHIRAMTNDKGRRIKEAGPSIPVEITGLSEVPEAGDLFYVVADERVAKNLAEHRRQETHEKAIVGRNRITLDDLYNQIQSGKVQDLNLIIKADVQGSVEAIKATLLKMSNDKVKVRVIHDAVGSVTESDIRLAEVANAIIIGFNVRPSQNVTSMAEAAGVDLRLYRVIYDAINDVEKAMKGMLAPTFREVIDGHVEIRQIFKVSNVGSIGGAYVTDGKITRSSEIRVVREGIVVFDGKFASLKRFKDDAREVLAGFECGVMIDKFNDIREGDIVEAFHQEQVEV